MKTLILKELQYMGDQARGKVINTLSINLGLRKKITLTLFCLASKFL